MKKAKKIVALLLCAVLLIGASVAGTLAYLTHKTGTVTNTFTVGKVDLGEAGEGLDEAKVNVYGEPVDENNNVVELTNAPRTTSNQYKLIPGHTYTKDPTLHIKAGSEPCYVFVKVVNDIADIEATGNTTIAAQMAAKGWTAVAEGSNIYYQATPMDARNGQVNVTVFENFKLKTDADFSSYVDENGAVSATITVIGYAIQADGFVDNNNNNTAADEAWAAAPADWKN